MNKLVFIDNGKTVTDSLTVALVFRKEHDKVMRDIRELECSEEFSLANFGESTYTNDRGRTYPKYIITQDGFSFLVMGYTGKEAARFKEKYIAEFNRMREQIKPSVDLTGLSPQLQLLIAMEHRQLKIEQRQQETESQLTTIKETFLQRDDNWRQKINGLLNGAARRSGMDHKEVRNLSYQTLKDRTNCKLETRLENLRNRLADSGATKTRIADANKLDVIESDKMLKEIYTTIVKELSIGTLV